MMPLIFLTKIDAFDPDLRGVGLTQAFPHLLTFREVSW